MTAASGDRRVTGYLRIGDARFVAVVVVVIVFIRRDVLAIADFVVAANAIALPFFDSAGFVAGANIGLAALTVDSDVAGIVDGNATQIWRRQAWGDANVVGDDNDILVIAGRVVEHGATIQFNYSPIRGAVNVDGSGRLKFERERADTDHRANRCPS